MKNKKSNLKINLLLDLIRAGKKPILLTKRLDISKQLLSYYLRKLINQGVIRKKGFGTWEIVKDIPKLSSTKKNIRGHGFIWIIKVPENTKHWNKREEILIKNKINFKKTGNTIRIKIKGKKTWLNNKSIIIYDSNSFIATTPLETRKLAIYELLRTIKSIESKLGLKLNKYEFKSKREHYALVKNSLAIQCNKEGDKLNLYDNGEWWGAIDNSFNKDEFELFKTKSFSGLTNSTGANNYFNSHKNNNWKVTPDFILNTMNGIQQNQLIFAKNMESHIGAIKTLSREVKGLSRTIKSIRKENQSLKLKADRQRTLIDY